MTDKSLDQPGTIYKIGMRRAKTKEKPNLVQIYLRIRHKAQTDLRIGCLDVGN